MDPITIGTLAAAALAAGATEAGKAVLGAAARDAYDMLKSVVAGWAAPDVDDLESKARKGAPTKAREAVVAETIDARPEPDRDEVRALAVALSEALKAEGRGGALATTINQFNAYDNSRQYNAPGGTQNFGSTAGKAGDDT